MCSVLAKGLREINTLNRIASYIHINDSDGRVGHAIPESSMGSHALDINLLDNSQHMMHMICKHDCQFRLKPITDLNITSAPGIGITTKVTTAGGSTTFESGRQQPIQTLHATMQNSQNLRSLVPEHQLIKIWMHTT
jgi:hypothetical protein